MKATIVQAIIEVMKSHGQPMTITEIYNDIENKGLYAFKADQPEHVVRSQVRRHCEGLEFASASSTKYFIRNNSGRYWLANSPSRIKKTNKLITPVILGKDQLANLIKLHSSYIETFKSRMLKQLKGLDPIDFENFSRKLLTSYGFHEVYVTPPNKDGGIDGFGKLKVGLAHLNVAFQCKRYRDNNVQRPSVNQFRGDIQGRYEMGIFFTTASFSPGAKECSFQSGAVPIILIDGMAIIDIMIEKEFGIEKKELAVYESVLDLTYQKD